MTGRVTLKRLSVVLLVLPVLAGGEPAREGGGSKTPPFGVKVVGKGRPMILIPGLACSGEVWDTTVAHYKDRYECHVLTLAGFAGQPPVPGPFLDTVRQGLADYIRTRKLDKPVVVGHSLGGFLVYELGAREPDLVGPLVAVDGLPCLAGFINDKLDAETMKKQADQTRQRMEKARREEFLAQNKGMLRAWISDKKLCATAEKWGEDSDQATVARAMGELFGTDLRPEVAKIKAPLLVLGAWSREMESFGLTRDKAVKGYEAQVASAPTHKVAVAENARHFLMYDAPDWMFGRIDAFLAGK